jgi:hypothetical protein
MTARHVALRAAAAIAALALVTVGLSAGAASAAPSPRATGSLVRAAAPTTSGWTAGGLISGVSQPATSALPPSNGFATVGGCVFYAASTYAGGYCPSGGYSYDGPQPPSLRKWLNGRAFTACRFTELPLGMVVNAYEPPGGHFMLKTCLQGYDFAQPWNAQHITVEIYAQWVPDEHVHQWTHVDPWMNEFWDVLSEKNYYPLPRISSGPSAPVRVGTYQYFWATWVKALNSRQETEPSFDIPYATFSSGTVTLHAQLADFTIDPGQKGLDDIPCGQADVPFDPNARDSVPRSEGGDQSSSCWTVYQHSSASEERGFVLIHGLATWHVTVERGGNVLADLGDHSYTVKQRLAVGEVQTLNDW